MMKGRIILVVLLGSIAIYAAIKFADAERNTLNSPTNAGVQDLSPINTTGGIMVDREVNRSLPSNQAGSTPILRTSSREMTGGTVVQPASSP